MKISPLGRSYVVRKITFFLSDCIIVSAFLMLPLNLKGQSEKLELSPAIFTILFFYYLIMEIFVCFLLYVHE